MKDRELYLYACAFAVGKLMEKGSSTYATRVNDEEGEKTDKWVSCRWSEVMDWIAKEIDKE